MSPRPRQRRTYDRTGKHPLREFSFVRITHPAHAYYKHRGTVVQVEHPHVWVWIGHATVRANHRSVEVIAERE